MPIQLPTKKSEPNPNARFIMTIYGKPKCGKSTFCAQIPDALFLSTENGLNMLSVTKIDIDNFSQFVEVLHLLENAQPKPYKTIILDSITSLKDACENHILIKNKVETLQDIGYGKGYDLFKQLMHINIMRIFRAGYNVILVAHEEEERDKEGNKLGVSPAIAKKLKNEILGLCDYILHMDYSMQHNPETGRASPKMFLHTKPMQNVRLAGDRTGRLPEKIEPSYEVLRAEIAKAFHELNKKNNSVVVS